MFKKPVKDAVAHENVYQGAKYGGLRTVDEITAGMSALIPSDLSLDDVVFVCIGTDRSTGDALGPLVGTYLTGIGYANVIGTIDDPTHAMNLDERVESIPKGKTVIAIDACLGQLSSVGATAVIRGSIKPGAGVNKDLRNVGDYAITSVVNVGGFMEYFVLQNTRLAVTMKLAKDITSAIVNTFPLDGSRNATADKSALVGKQAAVQTERKRGRPRKARPEVTV